MTSRIVYLDNNATTQMAPEVIEALQSSYEAYGNASSMHTFGRRAAGYVEKARTQVAELLGCNADEIYFTSGATESNNTVFHIARSLIESGKGKRIITTAIEHPATIETTNYLRSEGFEVDRIGVSADGRLDFAELEAKMGPDVALVSVMTGNNETGTIQDVERASRLAHKHGALFHTDATQAIGKIEVDVRKWNLDYLSLSGHKFYGPKGIGVLFVKKGCPKKPFMNGGHQEGGFRAGTYNTQAIYGLGVAADLARRNLAYESAQLWAMREALRKGLLERVDDIVINGCQEHCLPGTLNVSFPRAEGESILLMLDMKGIAVSTGSACATGSLEPSYVLLAGGLDVELAHGSIRFSFGRYNTMEDVDYVLEVVPPVIKRLRELSTR
ncbi:MAG: aminotransferase class V-fold PLP-dependent enzyme [Sphaerochaetaceae bacterium]|jgi:cysteine desulfurase|nr:aminotransferase class V-fold PLP-dependent enzyme [Sphaerochaetaceae bacterium]